MMVVVNAIVFSELCLKSKCGVADVATISVFTYMNSGVLQEIVGLGVAAIAILAFVGALKFKN
jgi:hypothetical protein